MNVFKAFAISFSLYSKIPMPQFEWGDKDMKYSLIFFPWVGLVIMGLNYIWYRISMILGVSDIIIALPLIVIPLLITGGFHLDGYMDVEDALKSYAEPERKLEIMKDPHIGAFAIIRVIILGLIYMTAILLIVSKAGEKDILVCGLGFPIARALSGISVIRFRPAKKDGMLKKESEVEGNVVLISLVITLIILLIIGVLLNPVLGVSIGVASLVCLCSYKRKSYKEFGGITGDTSGYFVITCEEWIAITIAVILCVKQYILL